MSEFSEALREADFPRYQRAWQAEERAAGFVPCDAELASHLFDRLVGKNDQLLRVLRAAQQEDV